MRVLTRNTRIVFALLVIVALAASGCSSDADSSDTESSGDGPTTATWSLETGYQMPQSVPSPATQAAWDDMGWQTFIALNWPAASSEWPANPALGSPGEPAVDQSITDVAGSYPAVWQTYLSPEQVFLNKGADPGTWDDPTNAVEVMVDAASGQSLPVFGGFSKGSTSGEAFGDFNEATSNPLIDQNGNYVNFEIRMNQSEVEYMTTNRFYDAKYQMEATADGGTIPAMPKTGQESGLDLPSWAQQGALEIKASWRILVASDVSERYFTVDAFRRLPGGAVDGPFTFGLVGLHILRLTPASGSTWYWATFEQVDNVRIDTDPMPGLLPSFNPGTSAPYPTYAKGWEYNGQDQTPPSKVTTTGGLPPSSPVDVSFIENAIQPSMQALNENYQSLLAGTPWQYYQMIGALNPAAAGSPVPPFNNPSNTDQLVNTTMETFSQGTESAPVSCVSCHSNAIPQGADTQKVGQGTYPAQAGNQIFTYMFSKAESSD